MTHKIVPLPLIALLVMLVTPDVWATAQDKTEVLKETSYRLDASFPQQTDGLVWQATSAVAIDSRGHIYVFHRAKEPILKFDRSGKLFASLWRGLVRIATRYAHRRPRQLMGHRQCEPYGGQAERRGASAAELGRA